MFFLKCLLAFLFRFPKEWGKNNKELSLRCLKKNTVAAPNDSTRFCL